MLTSLPNDVGGGGARHIRAHGERRSASRPVARSAVGLTRRVLRLVSRIEAVADSADLEDVYDTERHLLYVACTRARDRLLVTGVEPASEFLEDLSVQRKEAAR